MVGCRFRLADILHIIFCTAYLVQFDGYLEYRPTSKTRNASDKLFKKSVANLACKACKANRVPA